MNGLIRRRCAACPFPLLAALIGVCGAFAGCAAPLNESSGLLGVDLEALSPPGRGLSGSDRPSLEGLDRGHWPLVRLRVPGGQVEHYPTFVGFTRVGPPGQYPTATTALEVGDGLVHEVRQALRQPALAALAVIAWPLELASGSGPWRARRSDRVPFEREAPRRPEAPWTWVAPARQPLP